MDYINEVLKTESNDYERIKVRIATKKNVRLLHAALGMQTESGEFSDQIKKYIFYDKDLDRTNLIEEIGDLLWYVAIALHELKSSFSEAELSNIRKLFTRYGVEFDEEKALNRNLELEIKALNIEPKIPIYCGICKQKNSPNSLACSQCGTLL
jgi:NTP pyrophosphatase (non-canonical NTP hydrolase)